MKTIKKMLLCCSMVLMLMLMGSTVWAGTTYGYLNKSVNYNTKSCDLRYHAVAPTKFTFTAAVAGKTPVSKIRIYNSSTSYKEFSSTDKYWTYNASKNISVFAVSLSVASTKDVRFLVYKDSVANGRTIAVNVKGSIETRPVNVTVTAASTTILNLKCDKIPGVTGYAVYRSTSKTGTYKKLGTVSSNACRVSGLKAGTTYYYKVRAYYKSGNEILRSKWSAIKAAKTLSTPVYTNKLVKLSTGTTYKSYDFTGDGQVDTFTYTITDGKAKIYIGGKYKQSLDLLRGGWLYFCSVDRANTYIITICGQSHGQTFNIYQYSAGKFKPVSSAVAYTDYMLDYSEPVSISNNILTVKTTPCTLDWQTTGNAGIFKSFSDVKLKGSNSLGYNVRFKLVNGKLSLYSQIFPAAGRTVYYAKNSFKTSASYSKLSVKDGPIVTQGQKVTVKNIIIAGKTPLEGKNVFQIEANGKTGWFTDSSYIMLGI